MKILIGLIAALTLSLGAPALGAAIEEVPTKDVTQGILDGGGPNVEGLIEQTAPTLDRGVIVGRNWKFYVDEKGRPVTQHGARYLVTVHCVRFDSRAVPIYSCSMTVIDISTHVEMRGGLSGPTPFVSVREAVAAALRDLNDGVTGAVNTSKQ